jgi:hypothetical protein
MPKPTCEIYQLSNPIYENYWTDILDRENLNQIKLIITDRKKDYQFILIKYDYQELWSMYVYNTKRLYDTMCEYTLKGLIEYFQDQYPNQIPSMVAILTELKL